MRSMASLLVACASVLATALAIAGALDECMIKGDQAAVNRCLIEAEKVMRVGVITERQYNAVRYNNEWL